MTAADPTVFFSGILLALMETAKQLFLYSVVFEGNYNVWYFPFQLCSVPMYLCIFYGVAGFFSKSCTSDALSRPLYEARKISVTFIRDFGLLGGIMALAVPDGFTWTDYPLLTLHGYVWHIILIFLSIYAYRRRLGYERIGDFVKTVPLFCFLAAVAELLNISLSSEGADCDMFYISPYHLSSQPVFSHIDRAVGRIPGIFIYLFCILLGAFLIHCMFYLISRHFEKK